MSRQQSENVEVGENDDARCEKLKLNPDPNVALLGLCESTLKWARSSQAFGSLGFNVNVVFPSLVLFPLQ